ncbi:MAG: hypothetical protein RLY21_2065 [Planctomycetota bacterium]
MASEPRFLYAVRSRFTNREVRADFIAWLAGGHLADVVRAGAIDAELVEFEPETADAIGDVESRYHFASREAYEAYASGPAVALRAEGMAKFPPDRGIVMTRVFARSVVRVP